MPSTPRDTRFSVSVTDYPAQELIGMKIRTTMETCQDDCPKLWRETFIRWIEQLYPEGNCPSWGVSTAYDAATGSFDYWALIKAPEGQGIPKELGSFTLPAGLYAECPLTSVAEIHTAYHFLYSRWLPSQTIYIGLEDAACFEYCPPDFLQTGHLSVCIPVVRR
ncbi:GyrI-like domain-containing protein [Oxalobacter sp. OttesenSCG-928-P03]|nr:GyrI-like domain-containing protein [Oxalobacter sp. OttesenSCG-928-P03]